VTYGLDANVDTPPTAATIAQAIMRRHGSEIKVRSEEHVSTTFSFTLAASG